MSISSDILAALESGFLAIGIDPDSEVRWPNQAFNQLETRWYQVDILLTSRQIIDLATFYETQGQVLVSIYSGLNTSTTQHDAIADDIKQILDDKDLNNSLRMRESQIITVGKFNAFWVSRISTDFIHMGES